MIRGIRRKFIRIALLVLALAMVLVALVINVANWASTRSELSETLAYLTQNGGAFARGFGGKSRHSRGFQNRLEESRFFSVIQTADGRLMMNDTSRVADYGEDELADIARRALDSGRPEGFLGEYLYGTAALKDGGRVAVFLNCATRLSALRHLALLSAAACAGGILLAWLLVALFSRRAIQPMVDNAVRQKQFITDAGHELKTPLTVISANMDVLALESGENDWIRSTQKQVANLRGLVNELIYLSRLDEEDVRPQLRGLDLSRLLRETAEPFEAMAEFGGKSMAVSAGEAVRVQGDEAMLRRLISVLCDNAVKYASEGDAIDVSLRRAGRYVRLSTENGLKAPLSGEALARLFDRFYRADASRSKESGGYGIGLSVARTIVEKHGGSIRAGMTPSGRLRFSVALPGAGPAARREGPAAEQGRRAAGLPHG